MGGETVEACKNGGNQIKWGGTQYISGR
jgi:hypothetical protein